MKYLMVLLVTLFVDPEAFVIVRPPIQMPVLVTLML
jgi:hypothetical protein